MEISVDMGGFHFKNLISKRHMWGRLSMPFMEMGLNVGRAKEFNSAGHYEAV
jgi:hypothetical protein